MADLLGVILAGGLSRRMEGPEKTLLDLNDTPLLTHVKSKLAPQVDRLILNANGDVKRFSKFELDVQKDTVEGFAGPLAGVLAGMRWAEENSNATHIITAAADTPFFPDTYVYQMLAGAEEQKADIALASSNGRQHPVFGLWPINLADKLENFLVKENNRKVMLFVERYAHCKIEFENLKNDVDPFFNVNTPDDMKKAQEIISGL